MMMACGLAVSGDAEDTAGSGAARVPAKWSPPTGSDPAASSRAGLITWALSAATSPKANLVFSGTTAKCRCLRDDGSLSSGAMLMVALPRTRRRRRLYGSPPANVVQVVPFSWASYILPYAVVDTSRPGGAQGRRWHFFVLFYGAIQEIESLQHHDDHVAHGDGGGGVFTRL